MTLCPFASRCWMGGGSYACVKIPPFCNEPLIPKERDVEPECEPFAIPVEEPHENGGDDVEPVIQTIQGELF